MGYGPVDGMRLWCCCVSGSSGRSGQLLILDGQSWGLFWGVEFLSPPSAALEETPTTLRGSSLASKGSRASCLWCLVNFQTQAVAFSTRRAARLSCGVVLP